MRKILFCSLLAVVSFQTLATSHIEHGYLKTGVAMGSTTASQPILVISSYNNFHNCFLLGEAKLAVPKINIEINKMSCADDKFYYEYQVRDTVLAANNQEGINATHVEPSKELAASLKQLTLMYQSVNDKVSLFELAKIAQGHWELNANEEIYVIFKEQPVLMKKTPMSQ